MAEERRTLSGYDKAAILLKVFGPNLARPLFDGLSEADILKVKARLGELNEVTVEEAKQVLDEFYLSFVSKQMLRSKEVLSSPFAFLSSMNDTQILHLLQDEGSRIIALALAQLPSEQAARIVPKLPLDLQADVVIELGKLDEIPPDAVEEIAAHLAEKALTVPRFAEVSTGGARSLAEILEKLDPRVEKQLLEALHKRDPQLATQLKKVYFTFEDIVLLPDDIVREVLRGMETSTLALSLKGAPEEVKGKIIENMAERTRAMLQDELNMLGPVPRRKVDDARRAVVDRVHELERSGLFSLEDITESEYIE